MKIILTESGVVSNISCTFIKAIATNNSTNETYVLFFDGISENNTNIKIQVLPNSIFDITTLGGLVTNNGLYVNIGECNSVEIEII